MANFNESSRQQQRDYLEVIDNCQKRLKLYDEILGAG
jgi:hypothetical protein